MSSRRARTRRPTTNCSTTSTSATTPCTTRRRRRGWVRRQRSDGGARSAAAGEGRVASCASSTRRRCRNCPAVNPNITVMTMAEKCADLIRTGLSHAGRPAADDLTSFLGEHTPFQAMADDELAELAAGSRLVDFPAGAVVADYATRVPDDVWMVRSGQVTLHASADGYHRSTPSNRAASSATPRCSPAAGMEFEARTTAPSTLIRLPGALVRAQFAKPAGLAFLASSAWNVAARADRPDDRARRPTAGPSANSCTARCCWSDPTTSVRDAVCRMTEHHVSYALIRLARRRIGHLHRPRPAHPGGRRRTARRRADHPR